MSNDALSQSDLPVVPGTKLAAAFVLVLWFGLVFVLGAGGAFVAPPGSVPIAILAGVTAPIIGFLAAFGISPRFREFVLTVDRRVMMGIQAWRFAGLGFLALYANGVLPGMFAWPAGLGDLAIGATAPWMLLALIRRPGFASSKLFVAWNVFGILDLVVAVGAGALSSGLAGADARVTTGPMTQLPLLLVPAYLVPIFVMLHIAALYQARR